MGEKLLIKQLLTNYWKQRNKSVTLCTKTDKHKQEVAGSKDEGQPDKPRLDRGST